MDVEKVTRTQMCRCGRNVIGLAGTCPQCIREGAEAFWAYVNGEISFPGFMRRLRRTRGKNH